MSKLQTIDADTLPMRLRYVVLAKPASTVQRSNEREVN